MIGIALLALLAQETPVTGDLNFYGVGDHVIQVQPEVLNVGRGLTVRAGHGLQGGGTLDLMAGNSVLPNTNIPGSIGIGRVEGSAKIITIGRLSDPSPTEKSYFRGRQLFIDGRESMSLRAPEVNIGAISPLSVAESTVALRLMVSWGVAFFAGTDHVDIGFNDSTVIQLYAGGLILQKNALGKLAFYDGVPVSRPVVSGSLSNGEALASLVRALAELNLIQNATTP